MFNLSNCCSSYCIRCIVFPCHLQWIDPRPLKKQLTHQPKRPRCPNETLMACKGENSSPGGPQDPATPVPSPGPATQAPSPEPAATAPGSGKKAKTAGKVWQKVKPGRLAMTLSSPSTPGMSVNRSAAPLAGGHRRHPPPPPNVLNNDPPNTPAATAAHLLHQQADPASDRGKPQTYTKKIANAFNAAGAF